MSKEILEQVSSLYNQGLFAQAWEHGKTLGQPTDWLGVEGQILGGRLLMNLGGNRLGRLQHLRTGRAHPEHDEAAYYFLFAYAERRGGFAAWRWRQRRGMAKSGTPKQIADCYGQCAQLLAGLRDFERAEEFLKKAKDAAEPDTWFYVQSAYIYEAQDRYDKAADLVDQALSMNERYKPAVLAKARLLELNGDDDESLEYLRRMSTELESPHLHTQLLDDCIEREDYEGAEKALADTERTALFTDKYFQSWMHYKRVEIACNRGHYEAAAEHAAGIEERFFHEIAKSIRKFYADHPDKEPIRRRLPVDFVRQHHMTCVPATLSALSRYWQRPAEHLNIAEEICYDGTPAHSERKWAENNGYLAREFTVTWDNCVALIDRGIPFTLTTTAVSSGHLQAVIGYDEVKNVFLVRDPFIRKTLEMSVERLLEDQALSGPRGMLLVPEDRQELVEGLNLNDAELYDQLHELNLALTAHDRLAAVAKLDSMAASDETHRLTWHARRTLGYYDGNTQEVLHAIEGLLKLFPKDTSLNLAKLVALREIGTRDERLQWLEDACADPECSPYLLLDWVRELEMDDRESDRSGSLLRRVLRIAPDMLQGIYETANHMWNAGDREESLDCYRLASCVGDMQEGYARSYFAATRHFRRQEEALTLLKKRFERFGKKSAAPAISYIEALDALDRVPESFEVLNTALELRSDDGELLLFAARRHGALGRREQAGELLQKAKGKVKNTEWLMEQAQQERQQGESEEALTHLREIVASQPFDVSAHAMIASIMADREGPSQGIEYVAKVSTQHPRHWGLCNLWYSWLGEESAEVRGEGIDRLLALDDANSWSLREKGLVLYQQGKFEDAQKFLLRAIEADERNPIGHSLLGQVQRGLGLSSEARESFRKAITISADISGAIYGLIDLCDESLDELKNAIAFVEDQMVNQALLGDGLLTFRQVARGVLTPDELLTSLRRAHRERPDLWHAWSALSHHLSDMGRHQEAEEIARGATDRFPLLPVCWLDLADVNRAQLNVEGEIVALEKALELNRDWTQAITRLCETHERRGDLASSREILTKAVERMPGDAILKGSLADVLYRQREVDEALKLIGEAVRIDPGYQWAWESIQQWSLSEGREDAALTAAQELVEERPNELRAWLRLAELQEGARDPSAALASLDKALAINPASVSALENKAIVLTQLHRFPEAEEACRTVDSDGRVPMALRGREAWVDVQRGALSSGIAKLEKVLQDNPDYEFGWQMMIEWRSQSGEFEQAMSAAESLSWLQPQNVVPLGWLGNANRRLDKPQEATRIFERALRMQPGYFYAAIQLVELCCEQDLFDEAQRVIEQISLETPPADITVLKIKILVAERRGMEGLDLFEELCSDPNTDSDALDEATQLLVQAGHAKYLENALDKAMKQERFHDRVVYLWCWLRARRGKLGGFLLYRKLRAMGDAGRKAMCAILDQMGDNESKASGRSLGNRYRLFLIRKIFRNWLAQDDMLWGKLGYVLACRADHASVISHMRDWKSRAGLQGWMIHNLAVAYLVKGRSGKASELFDFGTDNAADLGGNDADFRLMATLDACNRGESERARTQMHKTPLESVEDGLIPIRQFARLLIQTLAEPSGKRTLSADQQKWVKEVRAHIRDPLWGPLISNSLSTLGKHIQDGGMRFSSWFDRQSKLTWGILAYLIIKITSIIVSMNK